MNFNRLFPVIGSIILALSTSSAFASQHHFERELLPLNAEGVIDLNEIPEDVTIVSGVVRVEEVVVEDPNPRLNRKQKKELWITGTVTDSEGRVWNIWVVPGTRKSKLWITEGWTDAGKEIQTLFGKELWGEDVPEAFKDGARYTKRAGKAFGRSFKDATYGVVVDMGRDIGSGYRTLVTDNRRLKNERPVGYPAIMVLNGLWFGVKAAWEVVEVPIESALRLTFDTTLYRGGALAGSMAYAPGYVMVRVVYHPVAALWNAAIEGTLVAGSYYTWNGFSWTVAHRSRVPERESAPWVTIITDPTDKNPGNPTPVELTVDAEDFNNLVAASIRGALMEQKVKELQDEVDALRKQLDERQEKISVERHQYGEAPEVKTLEQIVADSYSAQIRKLSPDVQAVYMDRENLVKLIDQVAVQLEVTLSPELKEQIVVRVHREVKRIIR